MEPLNQLSESDQHLLFDQCRLLDVVESEVIYLYIEQAIRAQKDR